MKSIHLALKDDATPTLVLFEVAFQIDPEAGPTDGEDQAQPETTPLEKFDALYASLSSQGSAKPDED